MMKTSLLVYESVCFNSICWLHKVIDLHNEQLSIQDLEILDSDLESKKHTDEYME